MNVSFQFSVPGKQSVLLACVHYGNIPIQYTRIFSEAAKIEHYIGKILMFLIFLPKTLIVGTH